MGKFRELEPVIRMSHNNVLKNMEGCAVCYSDNNRRQYGSNSRHFVKNYKEVLKWQQTHHQETDIAMGL